MTTRAPLSWKTIVVCALVLAGAAGATAMIFSTEPTAKRGGATKQTAMLVEVTGVERGTFHPEIVATGTVEAEQDIILSPRVGGEIVARAPAFTPGGFVNEGDVLLRIDPRDFRNALQQRQSALRQARADLAIEMGRQDVAQQDYELLGKELSEENKALVLRKPQLEAAQVHVEAAQAAVDQARLDLQRTAIEAPFDAQVIRRDVNVGSQVAPGDPLGRLVGLDTYWVVAAVPVSKLRWLSFPEADGARGSEVMVRNRAAWPEGVHRTGYLYKLIGALEGQTRMARVVVTIPDPLARTSELPEGTPPLIVGEYLETRIRGTALPDVVRLDRRYVRDGDTVWVMEDGALRIREVDVVVRDAQYAYISGGLTEKDQVVTTNLATVTDGAALRLEGGEQDP